jgi:hypothetical protein
METDARAESGAAIVRRWKALAGLNGPSSPVMTGNEIARLFAIQHPEFTDMETLVRRMVVDVGLHLRARSISFESMVSSISEENVVSPARNDAADEQAVLGALSQLLDDRELSHDDVFAAARDEVREIAGTERPGINL